MTVLRPAPVVETRRHAFEVDYAGEPTPTNYMTHLAITYRREVGPWVATLVLETWTRGAEAGHTELSSESSETLPRPSAAVAKIVDQYREPQ